MFNEIFKIFIRFKERSHGKRHENEIQSQRNDQTKLI